ncbi:hypothetical protein ACIRS1_35290 [Kitasatospora sp. NPDC101176]
MLDATPLAGTHVRLEPLDHRHFSVVRPDWPAVREALTERLARATR